MRLFSKELTANDTRFRRCKVGLIKIKLLSMWTFPMVEIEVLMFAA
jgi:hypothetical protein